MVSRDLSLKLFRAFSIERWNDRVRPARMIEMDKHAHKMIIAFFLARYEEEGRGADIDWAYLIDGGMFALLKNIVVSDIKAPVWEEIAKDSRVMKDINDWVVDQWSHLLDSETAARLQTFLQADEKALSENINFRILRAAHKYSTFREFHIIKHANLHDPHLADIEADLKRSIATFMDFVGLQEIVAEQELHRVLSLTEQLRYQVRWSQTERIPRTSVLGHSMLVAAFMYFLGREVHACPRRAYNDFFCGLFHDLPEALTRDIISPVKRATPGLPSAISRIEKRVMESQILSLLKPAVASDLRYYTQKEFEDKIFEGAKARILTRSESMDAFNTDNFNPLDGKLVKLADEMAALLEAHVSLESGIKSADLISGRDSLVNKYTQRARIVSGIEVADFFESFRHHA
jgi:putative hydrolases of HD superfamily